MKQIISELPRDLVCGILIKGNTRGNSLPAAVQSHLYNENQFSLLFNDLLKVCANSIFQAWRVIFLIP